MGKVFIVVGIGKNGSVTLFNKIKHDRNNYIPVKFKRKELKKDNAFHIHKFDTLKYTVDSHKEVNEIFILIPIRLDIKLQEVSRFFQYIGNTKRAQPIFHPNVHIMFRNYLNDDSILKNSKMHDNGKTYYENLYIDIIDFLKIPIPIKFNFEYNPQPNIKVLFLVTEEIDNHINDIIKFMGKENYQEHHNRHVRQDRKHDEELIKILMDSKFKNGIERIEKYVNELFVIPSHLKAHHSTDS